MANLQRNPTIVVVPGSFSTEILYTRLIDKVKSRGYETVYITLPTTIKRVGPGPSMYDDAAKIHSVCEKLADAGKDIVLTMHSYGGTAGTQGARDLGKKDREAAGKKGGIISLVYWTAVVPLAGQTNITAMGDEMPSDDATEGLDLTSPWMSVPPEYHALHTFSDLPYDEGLKWGAKLSQHSASSFNDKLSYEAYRHIPVVYLICTEDKIISVELQRKMVENVKKVNGEVEVLVCNSGHCPGLTQPESVVRAFSIGAGECELLEV